MHDAIAPGWYPDTATGGTRFWDGSRWTGDVRPPRRAFAAASAQPLFGGLAIMQGTLMGAFLILGYTESHEAGFIVAGALVALAGLIGGLYLLRGRGPSTQEVEARLESERKEAAAKRRKANAWGVVAGFERLLRPRSTATESGSAAAAQIEALADPATAQSIQNLQKLLYTRAITDEEFEAAKDKLVGQADDQFSQITKLAELHEAGVLGDIEFATAKARALGL